MGVFYTNLIAREYVQMSGFFSIYYLEQYQVVDINVPDFLIYIIGIRIVPVVLIFLFSITILHKWISGSIIWGTGVAGGILMSTGILQMGMKGILLGIISAFPHMCFYAPAYMMVLSFGYHYPENHWTRMKTLILIASIIVGIILELYLSPVIVKWFIGIM